MQGMGEAPAGLLSIRVCHIMCVVRGQPARVGFLLSSCTEDPTQVVTHGDGSLYRLSHFASPDNLGVVFPSPCSLGSVEPQNTMFCRHLLPFLSVKS